MNAQIFEGHLMSRFGLFGCKLLFNNSLLRGLNVFVTIIFYIIIWVKYFSQKYYDQF